MNALLSKRKTCTFKFITEKNHLSDFIIETILTQRTTDFVLPTMNAFEFTE